LNDGPIHLHFKRTIGRHLLQADGHRFGAAAVFDEHAGLRHDARSILRGNRKCGGSRQQQRADNSQGHFHAHRILLNVRQ
jgi:hypothetical protein